MWVAAPLKSSAPFTVKVFERRARVEPGAGSLRASDPAIVSSGPLNASVEPPLRVTALA